MTDERDETQTPVPLRLNLGEIAGETVATSADALGTLRFAPAFLRRLEAALRSETWEDRLPPSRWDESPYVVGRLRRTLGDAAVAAVLAVRAAEAALTTDETYQAFEDWRACRPYREARLREAAARFGMRLGEVERAERRIGSMVRHGLMLVRAKAGGGRV